VPDSRHVLVELRGALAARPDGFLIFITTQSKQPPSGVFRSELAKARAVRDGQISLPLLPILYELPDELAADEGWKDRRYWQAVNPNLGRSVSADFLQRELENAGREGAAALALFASQHFNVEIGIGLKTDRWLGADWWLRRATPDLTLDRLLAESDVVVIGIDGGGSDDLMGLAVIGRRRTDRTWLIWNRAWAFRKVLELRRQIAPKLLDLEQTGDLVLVADESNDAVEGVADVIDRCEGAGLLPEKGAIWVDTIGISLVMDDGDRPRSDRTARKSGAPETVQQRAVRQRQIRHRPRRCRATARDRPGQPRPAERRRPGGGGRPPF